MRRILVTLICLLLVCALAAPAFAMEVPSSIPAELIPDGPFFIYSGNLAQAFGGAKSFDAVNSNGLDRILVTPIVTDHSQTLQYTKTNSNGEMEELLFALDWDSFRFYLENDLTNYLGNDVVIETKCYYKGTNNTGVAIHYNTNKGEYVYFVHDQLKPCLFSMDAFGRFMKWVTLRENQKDSWDRWKNVDFDFWPLSRYELDSADFDPNAVAVPDIDPIPQNWGLTTLILTGLVAIVLVGIYLVYKFQYAKHQPEEKH